MKEGGAVVSGSTLDDALLDSRSLGSPPLDGLLTPKPPGDGEPGGDGEETAAAEEYDPTSIEATSSTWRNNIMWMTYDVADTWWVTVYSSVGSVVYAELIGTRLGWSYSKSSAFALDFVSASNILLIPFIPIVGALSDIYGNRKTPVIVTSVFVLLSAIFNAVGDSIWLACICYLTGNLFLQLARMCYDSQVPFVCEPKRRAVVQSIGGAIGALGTIIAIGWSMTSKAIWGAWVLPPEHGNGAAQSSSPSLFLNSTSGSNPAHVEGVVFGGIRWFLIGGGVIYGLICTPYLFHHERQKRLPGTFKDALKKIGRELLFATKEILHDRNMILYLIGMSIVLDAFYTSQVITSLTVQGGIGLSSGVQDMISLIVTLLCFAFAVGGGFLINRVGCRVLMLVCIGTQCLTEVSTILAGWQVGGRVLSPTFGIFGIVTLGIALGLLTCTPRMFITHLSPPARIASWAAVGRIFSKILSSVSPSIYAAILKLGMQRGFSLNMSIRFIYFFRLAMFLVAFLAIFFIVDPYKRYIAGERAPFHGIFKTGGNLPHVNALPLTSQEPSPPVQQ